MLLQPITVPFSKSTLKPSVYTLMFYLILGIFYRHISSQDPQKWFATDSAYVRVISLQPMHKISFISFCNI